MTRWRGAEAERAELGHKWFAPEVGFPSLGFAAAEWIEAHCVIPDGPYAGEPFTLTDEMVRFLVHFYRVDPVAVNPKTNGPRWVYERGGQLVRPQKWGKGPFSAAVLLWEAHGDAVPDGFDAAGRVVGRPWPTPWLQVTAVSEDQVANVFRALLPMVQLGPLASAIPDAGLTRINLPNGGRIEPVTASARSRLGQRVTFCLQDETHSWVASTGGVALADNQRRNLAGMSGRFLETTNAWDISEGSVAQLTAENAVGVFVDYPVPPAGSVTNRSERRRVMRRVYGDSATARAGALWRPWVDLDRIEVEIEALLARDPGQAERFFLNRAHQGSTVAFDLEAWSRASHPDRVVPDSALITIGVDGARFDDALAIVATEVETFHQWPIFIAERPVHAGPGYEHDLDAADRAVQWAFDRWNVWRLYADPQRIEVLIDRWLGRWSKDRVVEWFTNQPNSRKVADAVRVFTEAVARGDMSHDGDSDFARHVANARRKPLQVKDDEGRPMWSVQKDRPGSPNKIDAAMAAILSAQARADAIAAGELHAKPRWFMGV